MQDSAKKAFLHHELAQCLKLKAEAEEADGYVRIVRIETYKTACSLLVSHHGPELLELLQQETNNA